MFDDFSEMQDINNLQTSATITSDTSSGTELNQTPKNNKHRYNCPQGRTV